MAAMKSKVLIMSLVSGLALSACSVFGIRSGTEEPHYVVVQASGPLQIREYGARLAAETEVTGSEYSARGDGFKRLARYYSATTPANAA